MKRMSLIIAMAMLSAAAMAQKIVYTQEATQQSPGITIAVPDSQRAEKSVVVVPGGGYNHLAGGKEGEDWIDFFTTRGVAVAVVRYRLPEGDRTRPLGDVQTAFQLLREHATEWNVNPEGIGIMGFSAGGHLAAAYTGSSEIELKPRFQLLFYPVVRLDNRDHLGMAKKFLGNDCSDAERQAWSTHNMINSLTPTTFLCLADDDGTISPTNATLYYNTLRDHHIPATMHIYPNGGHGFGAAKSFPHRQRMMDEVAQFVENVKVPQQNAPRVACVGNSITYGAKLKKRQTEAYPAQLQQLLGDGYWVKNFGVSGTTMQPSAVQYTGCAEWKDVQDFAPNIVIVKLGTNDAQRRYFKSVEAYTAAYDSLVTTLKALPTKPRILLCLPTASYRDEKISDELMNQSILPAIRSIAQRHNLEVVDLHTPTENHEELFPDKLHPNAEGAKIIATTVARQLLEHQGSDATLSMQSERHHDNGTFGLQ